MQHGEHSRPDVLELDHLSESDSKQASEEVRPDVLELDYLSKYASKQVRKQAGKVVGRRAGEEVVGR